MNSKEKNHVEILYNDIFEKNNFILTNNTKHSLEYEFEDGIDVIYLANRKTTITIVVNPITVENNLELNNRKEKGKNPLFGSSYRKFIKKLNKGIDENHYGYAYKFNTPDELDYFLKFLGGIFTENILNIEADYKLLLGLNNEDLSKITTGFDYIAQPKEKKGSLIISNHKVYFRERQTSLNALSMANFKCEIDTSHPTFIRKNTSINYTEPHHLIPMSYSDKFEVSLDVEANIVSLCSNCHNHLHYGRNIEPLLRKLYDERKDLLLSAGIDVNYEDLLKIYL